MPWTLDDDAAEPLFRQAVELGITFWDTANVYGIGTSEEIVGRAIKQLHHAARTSCWRPSCSPMHDGPGGSGPLAQGDHGAGRRVAAPPRHRLRRPAPDPPLRPDDPGRGDDGSAARRGQGRQGPLPRRLVDVGLAVRQDAARRRAPRLDQVRLDAGPVQPARARGGARDVRPARRPGRRIDPVEPAGRRPGRPPVGRRPARRAAENPSTDVRPPVVPGLDKAIVDAVQRIAQTATCRWRRWRWPGC